MTQQPRHRFHPSLTWQFYYDRRGAHLPENAFPFRKGSCGVSHLAVVEYDYEHDYEHEHDPEIIHPFKTRDSEERFPFDMAQPNLKALSELSPSQPCPPHLGNVVLESCDWLLSRPRRTQEASSRFLSSQNPAWRLRRAQWSFEPTPLRPTKLPHLIPLRSLRLCER